MTLKTTRLCVCSASLSVVCLVGSGAHAQTVPAAAPTAPPAAAPQTPSAGTSASPPAPAPIGEIVVTATRLNAARESIQPSIGASSYTMNAQAIQAIPGGENVELNQVILQAPGVVQDSFGQLHVRDDHNGIQYRLNGVILPEGVSVFSQSISPRIIQKVELLTGALPAQYGLLTAGIVNITTKSGVFDNGGEASLYGGSHGEVEPSFTYGGSVAGTNFFVSGSFLQNQLGIESPDGSPTPHHDKTDQATGFVYLDRTIGDSDRVSVILGSSNQRFQIPDAAGLTPDLGLSVGRRELGVQSLPQRKSARDHRIRHCESPSRRRQMERSGLGLRALLDLDLSPDERSWRSAVRRRRPNGGEGRRLLGSAGRGILHAQCGEHAAGRGDPAGRPGRQSHPLSCSAGRRPRRPNEPDADRHPRRRRKDSDALFILPAE